MDFPLMTAAACGLLAAVVVLAALLVRQHGAVLRVRARCAELEARHRVRDDEARHLVRTRLPGIVASLAEPAMPVPGPAHGYGDPYGAVVSFVTWHLRQTREAATQAAASTLKSMMRSVQNLANEQQVAISDAEQRHDDPEVLADLLKIDHANSQLTRRAQATAVLCGSWPGQQRSATTLTDIARGATSRIRDFPRVVIPAPSDTAVVSRAVEPVVLAVAELLDNGARHSQPGSTVEVNFQQAHNGMAVVIDDAGVGMTAETVRRAAWLLSGQGRQEIAGLGDPPRIGFAVVGVLAARYGFTVSVDTRSPYGGLRAVLFLPSELLTRVSAPASVSATGSSPAPEPAPEIASAPADSPSAADEDVSTTANGLPRRRRKSSLPGFTPAPKSAPPRLEPVTAPGPSTLAAWQRGTREGRVPEESGKDSQ